MSEPALCAAAALPDFGSFEVFVVFAVQKQITAYVVMYKNAAIGADRNFEIQVQRGLTTVKDAIELGGR